ncbi:zinc-dependent peptidase, partial [Lutimonas sp.]|uniref:zinc-dependent peptidase n=1 Tax=Lutimonas sp. TaxID=1872403 RepID=UPI003D9BC5FF
MNSSFYYRKLSDLNKSIFCIRTLIFYRSTNFDHERNFELTLEMKLLISSAFVQITFGLKRDRLHILNNIFIAPRNYSYRHIDKLFKGDVNLNTKTVSLAWPAVQNGFNAPDDGINLCIHEFAHCLIIENSKSNFLSAIFDHRLLESWKKLGRKKVQKIKKNDSNFLRDYAGTNLMELFAVSLE